MSNPSRLAALTGTLLFSQLLFFAPVAGAAYADPPGRVGRLADTQGQVSYSPAGEDEWLGVVRNRPLIRGDRLWTDRDARAEFQVGSAVFRLGAETSAEVLDLDDRVAQIRVTQGTISLRVRRMDRGQAYEVATPTLAFSVTQPGRYRIDVDPRDDRTTVVVWDGAGVAYGENASFPLQAGDAVRFYDAGLSDYEIYDLPPPDAFDRYGLDRDRRLARSASLRYLNDDVAGYAELDAYGSWRPVPEYGTAWFPARVDADWAPYRDGQWVWQEPWGWTWVDNAPWGFAPSHYGRWVHVSDRWGWIPGPRNVRPVYAPALVAFVGGPGWSVSLSLGGDARVGWFPLGPREAYVPSYQSSREYFNRVNVNNTVINNTTITNVYNNYSTGNTNVTQVNYANRGVNGAVTAVPGAVFVNAQPVRPAAIRLDPKAIGTGEVTRVAPIAPTAHSVLGAAPAATARPARGTFERRVFARNAPPPAARPFASREPQLQQTPGRAPQAPAAESPRTADATPNVRVVAEQPAVNAREAAPRRGGGRDRQRQPGDAQQPAQRAGPATATPPAAETQRVDRPGQADTQRQATEQQQNRRQQQAERQQQQAERQQQQAERQRQADSARQTAEQQRVERQRQADAAQQSAEQQRAERQRQADSARQTVEQQRAERQRQADTAGQAAEQQRAERQRQADSARQTAEQQRVERQRQADSAQQAVEQQRIERERQVKSRPQDRQPGAEPDRASQAEKKRQDQRRAECVREARQSHQDESKCQNEPPPEKRATKDPGGDTPAADRSSP